MYLRLQLLNDEGEVVDATSTPRFDDEMAGEVFEIAGKLISDVYNTFGGLPK